MKTYYESPELEVIFLQSADAITSSLDDDELPPIGIINNY